MEGWYRRRRLGANAAPTGNAAHPERVAHRARGFNVDNTLPRTRQGPWLRSRKQSRDDDGDKQGR